MRRSTRPTTARAARWVAAALAAACWTLAAAGPAAAEPPVDLPGEVTDLADVLDPEQESALAAELDEFARSTPFQLFVVYVPDFDGQDPRGWADATAAASDLGRDDILLAVAVEARRYQVRVQHDNALTDAQLTAVEQDRIEPALRDGDWAGAAAAAAAGYAAAPPAATDGAEGGSSWTDWVFALTGLSVGLLVFASPVLVPLLLWWRRRRRTARAAREAAAVLRDLEDRSALALVAADEAVTRGTQERAYAEAQFGPATVAPFTRALDRAREILAEAFRLRRLLDDDAPEAPDRRRALAQSVVDACARVEALVERQEQEADRMRERHARAPEDLAEARDAARRLTARAQAAERAWVVVRQQYDPAATADVPAALAAVADAAATAEEHVVAGTSVLGTGRGAAVAHAREARAEVARGAAVLDGLDRLADDLRTAPAAIVAAVAELDADLADAARLAPEDPAVREAVTAARVSQDRARGAGHAGDPLPVLAALRAADRELDRTLAQVRAGEAARRHAVERLPRALDGVDRIIARARAVIARDPDAVGATAPARLADAERLAAEGAALVDRDPVAALRALRTAADRAEQAEEQAVRRLDAARLRARRLDPVRGTSGHHDSSGGAGGSSDSGDSRGGGGRF